jgi:aspartate kinase
MSKKQVKVFKFGGASLRNAAAIHNVGRIVKQNREQPLLLVVSAMGKTTNALEAIVNSQFQGKDFASELNLIRKYHREVLNELLPLNRLASTEVDNLFEVIGQEIKKGGGYDQVYDQVVSLGEVISSVILSHYLQQELSIVWIDSRKYISTDSTYREGKVNWEKTAANVRNLESLLQSSVGVAQGFIGCDERGLTTTLGREGSDFTAAIYGSCLDAESVTIWKDVPGVMNADPKRLPAAVVFEELPFREAAEMTYYGASVIHPKTIKPLANSGIPLLVKNFDDPTLPGTRITECKVEQLPPLIVFKDNQCLISCKVTDYTFVNEGQLTTIFQLVTNLDVKINLMQNSAISFSFCVDYHENKVMKLIGFLSTDFEVYYNTGLTLITIKNYNSATFHEYRSKPGLLLEQSSRSTLQVLIKNPV